jgi:hypothetical protein
MAKSSGGNGMAKIISWHGNMKSSNINENRRKYLKSGIENGSNQRKISIANRDSRKQWRKLAKSEKSGNGWQRQRFIRRGGAARRKPASVNNN